MFSSSFKMWPQILMMFLCNIAVLSYGLQTAWTTSLQPALQSNHSPIPIPPMTDDQISWIGSLPSITLTCFAPMFGFIMDRYGRKTALIITTAPNIITYLLLIFANDIYIIYASRLIGGFCSSGAFVVGPVYIAECTQPHLKGTLNSFTGFFMKLGMILSITLGAYVSYNTLNLVSGSFTVFFVLLSFWIPESPAFLVKYGRRSEAKATLAKLWGQKHLGQIEKEIKVIEDNLMDTTGSWKLVKFFFTERSLRMGCLICGSIFAFQMFSGYPAIIRYTVDILTDAGLQFSPYIASIVLATVQVFSSFAGALLIGRTGHKRLVVWSLAAMATSMAVMSGYLFLQNGYPENATIASANIITFIAVVLFILFYGAGFGTVPFSVIPILFTSQMRATASTLLNVWFAFAEFVGAQTFYSIRNQIDLSGALAVFAGIGFIGVLTLQCIMFELKGLETHQVQEKLSGEKPVTRTDLLLSVQS